MRAVYLPDQQSFLRFIEVPGADPPLLWLHGWQCTSTGELLETAVQHELSGRRSLLIDFLGHGYSDRPESFTYSMKDHAATIVSLIDTLGLTECGLVGHSMGATVAITVAAARPDVVTLLVMAEGGPQFADLAPRDSGRLEGQLEAEFVNWGFPRSLAELADNALSDHVGVAAVHLGITRSVDARAIHREAASMGSDDRELARILGALKAHRWYLHGALSAPEPEREEFLADSDIGFRIVPGAGHPMGIQNPAGFAATVAEVVARSWVSSP